MPPTVLLDSASDLDLFQAQEIGVDLLLQTVDFAGQVWLERSELENEALFRALRAGVKPPRTSPVSVEAYSNTLERMLARSPHVFAIHSVYMPGSLLEVASVAAARFPGQVTVYPSQGISASLAIQAERALIWLRQGMTPGAVVAQLNDLQERARLTLYLNTTEFFTPPALQQGLSGLLPGALPLLGFPEGRIQLVSQASSSTVALSMMRQRMQRKARELPGGDVVFFQCDASAPLATLQQTARQLALSERWVVTLGLGLAAYTGPGAYGFGIFPRL